MSTEVTNYQCPSCSGPLHFSSETGKLQCDHCGTAYTPDEIAALYANSDAAAQQAFATARAAEEAAEETVVEEAEAAPEEFAAAPISDDEKAARRQSRWDGATISADWGEEGNAMRAYSCPSCGAELLCEETTAATKCPYCDNPSIVPGQFAGALKPNYIIPFKLTRDQAVAALKQHYRKKLFLPRSFRDNNQISKLQGIYVPFWLFNAEAAAECAFAATNSTSHRSGDYIVTKTRHYDVRRAGNIRFVQVPTDASKKMPDDLMDSLEPYNYSELKPFSTAYLPGYLADKYDVSVEDDAARADNRCAASATEIMRNDVRGYQSVRLIQNDTYINRGKVEYALLPVWILKTRWDNKDYLFAMNGQTGKFVGNLPVSKKLFWAWLLGITAVLGVILCCTSARTALGELIYHLIAG